MYSISYSHAAAHTFKHTVCTCAHTHIRTYDDRAVYCSFQKQTWYTFRGYVLLGERDVTKFQGYVLAHTNTHTRIISLIHMHPHTLSLSLSPCLSCASSHIYPNMSHICPYMSHTVPISYMSLYVSHGTHICPYMSHTVPIYVLICLTVPFLCVLPLMPPPPTHPLPLQMWGVGCFTALNGDKYPQMWDQGV